MSELSILFYKTVKHNSACMICGTNNNLQFHHVEPADKISEVHKIAKNNDLATTIAEMNKCLPICDSDHRGIHKGLRRGWLKGHFDNGKPSNALFALPYLPYLPWFAKQKPHVIFEFYRHNVEASHNAVWPLLGGTGTPRLRLIK